MTHDGIIIWLLIQGWLAANPCLPHVTYDGQAVYRSNATVHYVPVCYKV